MRELILTVAFFVGIGFIVASGIAAFVHADKILFCMLLGQLLCYTAGESKVNP